jgi:hypothetical protein
VGDKRRKVWIDRFQTRLSLRLCSYFVLYQVAIWSLFWMGERLADQPDAASSPVAFFGSLLAPIAAIALGIVFIHDAIKVTHRVVGPAYRFRKTIESITAGEEMRLIKLRDGDELQDFKDDINAMLVELEKRGAITLIQPLEARKHEAATV